MQQLTLLGALGFENIFSKTRHQVLGAQRKKFNLIFEMLLYQYIEICQKYLEKILNYEEIIDSNCAFV